MYFNHNPILRYENKVHVLVNVNKLTLTQVELEVKQHSFCCHQYVVYRIYISQPINSNGSFYLSAECVLP